MRYPQNTNYVDFHTVCRVRRYSAGAVQTSRPYTTKNHDSSRPDLPPLRVDRDDVEPNADDPRAIGEESVLLPRLPNEVQ